MCLNYTSIKYIHWQVQRKDVTVVAFERIDVTNN